MKAQVNIKLSEMDVRQLYERLFSWHQKNRKKSKLPSNRRKKYLKLISDLPTPRDASTMDICFVCCEALEGLMAWSREEKDVHGVKVGEYANMAIEKLGGYLQAFQTAEGSELAWKYWPRRSSLMKLLHHISAEELRRIFLLYEKKQKISEAATKDFILRKIMEEIPSDQLLANPEISHLLASDFESLLSFFKNYIMNMEESDIRRICEDLKERKIVEKYGSKAKLVDLLFQNVPVSKIMESKIFQKRSKSKPTMKKDIKRIKAAMKALSNDLKQLQKKDSEILPYIQEIEQQLRNIIDQQSKLENVLAMKGSPDTKTILESFRKEIVSISEPISPDVLENIIEEVQNKLNTDRLSFTLRELEIIASLYILDQIKKIKWSLNIKEFMVIVREEIPKIQILPNQAEIPALRDRVVSRLGISDSAFDEQLIEAWKEGYVKLDVGAPIGRGNVEYLKYGQSEYFYVKLL